MRDWFLTLDHDELVDLALTENGLTASVTAKGRLALGLYRPFPTPTKPPSPEPARSRSRTGRERALVIGISDYPPPIRNSAGRRQRRAGDRQAAQVGKGKFPAQNVTSLTDRRRPKAVLDALEATFSGGPGRMMPYSPTWRVTGRSTGTNTSSSPMTPTPDRLATTGVPLKRIKDAFDASPSQRAFLWLDFCHSGGIIPRDLVAGTRRQGGHRVGR